MTKSRRTLRCQCLLTALKLLNQYEPQTSLLGELTLWRKPPSAGKLILGVDLGRFLQKSFEDFHERVRDRLPQGIAGNPHIILGTIARCLGKFEALVDLCLKPRLAH